MQKDDKSYSFLLSNSSNSRIFIKRVAVSKRYVHFGSVAIFLIFGITNLSVGLSGIVGSRVLAETLTHASPLTQVAAQSAPQFEPINYSRPSASGQLAFNSGGPEESTQGSDGDLELAGQLLAIQTTSSPANLPTMWAHLGKINNEFGFRRNPFGGRTYEFHPGMDIDGERGDIVMATAGGTVINAGYKGGYGNMVEIDHGNGLTSRYGHLSKIESQVGDMVTRGQLIAFIGSTGRSTGPHLHYELRLNDKPINPRHFLPAEPTDLSKIEKK
ncbi:MAG: M23 family metallopeptidase [Pyrinomonadaceae bacterium]